MNIGPVFIKLFGIRETIDYLKKMIDNFHILLSIGNTNKYQLPSKVIEYISLGKPVLHFAEIKDVAINTLSTIIGDFREA